MSPIIYVMITSEHVLPSVLSVRSQQPVPSKVLLITTQFYADAGVRLADQLKQLLPEVEVIALPSEDLSGESMQELVAWLDEHFLPLYRQFSDHNWVLNMTGGTKIMPMALTNAVHWYQIQYKAFKSPNIQAWRLNQKMVMDFMDIPVKSMPVEQALSLYVDIDIEFSKPLINDLENSGLAAEIYEAYQQPYHPHQLLSKQLEKLWSADIPSNPEYVTVPWSDLSIQDGSALQQWCAYLADLSDGAVQCDKEGVMLPTKHNRNKQVKAWIKWISGGWLESLLAQWLSEEDIPYARNVKLKNVKRELDIVLLVNGMIKVIEVKTAPDPNKTLSDVVQQIASIQSAGKLTNMLFMGPEFSRSVTSKDKWEYFIENCKANHIQLLESRQSLIDFVCR